MTPLSFWLLSLLVLAPAGRTAIAARAPSGPARPFRSAGVDALPDATVEIRGNVTVVVEGWSKNRVEVTGEASIEGSGTRIRIRGTPGRQFDAMTIKVPVGARLDIQTQVGDVQIKGITGEAAIESTAGNITIDSALEQATLSTVSGSVQVAGISNALEARTVSGDIRVKQVAGNLTVETTSGDVQIDQGDAPMVAISTISGNVRYTGRFARDQVHQIRAHSGSLQLAVPRSSPLSIHVNTLSGRIRTDVGRVVRQSTRKAEIIIGQGGPRLELQTFSGDVHVGATDSKPSPDPDNPSEPEHK